jgi:hypothetical protein
MEKRKTHINGLHNMRGRPSNTVSADQEGVQRLCIEDQATVSPSQDTTTNLCEGVDLTAQGLSQLLNTGTTAVIFTVAHDLSEMCVH